MKIIEDRGDEKVYLLPDKAVRLIINTKSRQVNIECADEVPYQVEEDGVWWKYEIKKSRKKKGDEWKGIEKA